MDKLDQLKTEIVRFAYLVKFEAGKLKNKRLLLDFAFLIILFSYPLLEKIPFIAKLNVSSVQKLGNATIDNLLNTIFSIYMVCEFTKKSIEIEGNKNFFLHQVINYRRPEVNIVLKVLAINFMIILLDLVCSFGQSLPMIFNSSLLGMLWFFYGKRALISMPMILVPNIFGIIIMPFFLIFTKRKLLEKLN
jgi:hypothetical protein